MVGARPLITGMVRPGMANVRGAPVSIRGAPMRPGAPRPTIAAVRAAPNGIPMRGGIQQRPIIRLGENVIFCFDPDPD
jgi:hypothetical protein